MAKRINVMLPETTIRALDRLAKPGERSRLIDKAVLHYAATRSAEGLREQLKQAALRDRDLDTETSEEWIAVDHESWQQLDTEENPSKGTGRSAAKSTLRHSTRR
jgi:metal-responsive CopG/Arc/MetJ family transcriptional regulator